MRKRETVDKMFAFAKAHPKLFHNFTPYTPKEMEALEKALKERQGKLNG
jgi:hypothetical protein